MTRHRCFRQSGRIPTLAPLLACIALLPFGCSFSISLSPLRTGSRISCQPSSCAVLSRQLLTNQNKQSSDGSVAFPRLGLTRYPLSSIFLSKKTRLAASADGEENSDLTSSPSTKRRNLTKLVSTVLVLLAIGAWNRTAIIAAYEAFNPSHLNDWLISRLDKLSNAGNIGLVIYTFFLVLWTMTAGMTTLVETAAGLAFGVRNGIICNAIGKTAGAVFSFSLGRHYLFNYVHRNLKNNELLQLVEESIEDNPLGVSLMVRFAPLPEFVKNFGLSVLKVKARYFTLAVVVHGVPFTCLWTCLGAETGRVMRGGIPSTTMKMLLSGVTWFGKSGCCCGFFSHSGLDAIYSRVCDPLAIIGLLISPTMIGLWVKSLRDKRMRRGEEASH
jgi:uncharacterized membrane protein YdjX (TVP38/TMEM64 family)